MSKVHKVVRLPDCDFKSSGDCSGPAKYDFRTIYGPWAYACEAHWKQHRGTEELGTGHGQELVVEEA